MNPPGGEPALVAVAPDYAPTPNEILEGTLAGFCTPRIPLGPSRQTPRQALEAVAAECLAAAPCHVLFSGGHDSSMLLAITVHVARRDGLPLPVPITYRYPGDALADETPWQELVIGHLGLDDWVKVDIHHEHEMLGEVARAALQRQGLHMTPAWWVMRLPEAVGGAPMPASERVPAPAVRATVISGLGGDEIGGRSPQPRLEALRRRDPTALREPRELWREWRRGTRWRKDVVDDWEDPLGWIAPSHRRAFALWEIEQARTVALDYGPAMQDLADHRAMRSTLDTARVAAAETGGRHVAPFHDRRVLAALASCYGRNYPRSRAELVREVAGDLLPAALVARASKAYVDTAFLGEQSRDWLRQWDGSGPLDHLVNGRRARELLLASCEGKDEGHTAPLMYAQGALLAGQ